MPRTRNAGPLTVNVLSDYDGTTGTLIETIERKPVRHTGRTPGRKRSQPFRTVTYRGQTHRVFQLPAVYGAIAGNCISVDSK